MNPLNPELFSHNPEALAALKNKSISAIDSAAVEIARSLRLKGYALASIEPGDMTRYQVLVAKHSVDGEIIVTLLSGGPMTAAILNLSTGPHYYGYLRDQFRHDPDHYHSTVVLVELLHRLGSWLTDSPNTERSDAEGQLLVACTKARALVTLNRSTDPHGTNPSGTPALRSVATGLDHLVEHATTIIGGFASRHDTDENTTDQPEDPNQ